MSLSKKYIVVEGPIGVGKTTLARHIAAYMGAELILEQPEENPFLERFYKMPDQYALQTQLHFLFQRIKQLKSLRQEDIFAPQVVADYMIDKDPLFARLTLDEDELFLYEKVYNQMSNEVPKPDLVILLQAPTHVLVERIRKRGILFERNMERAYLENLNDAYMRFSIDYKQAPLLTINAQHVNFSESQEYFQMLMQEIESISSGKHYFNPRD